MKFRYNFTNMKIKLILLSLFTISFCFVNAQWNLTEEYSKILSSNENTAKHVDYFFKTYEGSDIEARWGAKAILDGETLKTLYDSSIKSFSDTTNQILSCIESTQKFINMHLSYYSVIWSDAISRDAKYEFSNVDFREALRISKVEFKRIGVFEKLDNIKSLIQEKVLVYDKNEYVNTYKAYGLISQLISMAKDPSGSLLTFNRTTNRVDLELTKILSLAKLEHIK